jgi:putative membrane protein
MPYSRFRREEKSLRDLLARERTVLANERTLLAYIRTAIGLMAAGGTVLTVFPENGALRILGIALMALGGAAGAFGGWRFSVVAGHMRGLLAESGDDLAAPDGDASRSVGTGSSGGEGRG